jgi:hypothetical protein
VPNRFQLEGPSLDELNSRILAEFGPNAKVVSVRAITTGGLQGFFAKRRYEAEVEVPDGGSLDAHDLDDDSRVGIAQLLDAADTLEARAHLVDAIPRLSTNSVDFDSIMADLTYQTAQIVPIVEGPTVFRQAPLNGPGDVVVVIGLGNDPLDVARAMSATAGTRSLAVIGATIDDGLYRLNDRRSVLAARAAGVRWEQSVFVALGLPRSGLDDDGAFALHYLEADQVWVAVDAGRKPEDTKRWVRAVQAIVQVDAVAVVAGDSTTTPKTVHELGLQVGWAEDVSVG